MRSRPSRRCSNAFDSPPGRLLPGSPMASAGRGRRRRRKLATAAPHLETLLWRVGIRLVAGVDEVGMGPLAGPVIAAAVVLPPGTCLDGVADSKVLQAPVRERLAVEIRRRALAVGLGIVEPEEIDRLNIYRAGLAACRRALDALRPLVPGYVLVDGREIPDLPMPQSAYPKGDSFVCSIDAAAIEHTNESPRWRGTRSCASSTRAIRATASP